ncbi:GIY-YIG nuclease family protein [Candidatus Woesearchaeota archaeon]|nr:GIY-YIG nuclease family protein [Candidatus Woesearchaeota archaeon]
MEDYDFFQRHDSIKGVKVIGTDRLLLLDFKNRNYHELFNDTFGDFEIAGLYILINTKTKEIYVGESTNVKKRNKQEIKKGLDNKKLKNWKFHKIILIWDGRPTTTSLFGEDSFRKWLEKYCIQKFKEDKKYECVNSVSNPKPTNFQTKTNIQKYFDKHILLLLKNYGLINN